MRVAGGRGLIKEVIIDTTTFETNGTVLGPPGRRTVLDNAHVGDIRGALGTLRQHASRPRTKRHRLLALLAVMGPGLIVMVGDNDPAGSRPTPKPARTTGHRCCGRSSC